MPQLGDVPFSVQQKNDDPRFLIDQFRETWVGNDMSDECWCTTTIRTSKRFDLQACKIKDLPSPWGPIGTTITAFGEGKSAKWFFQLSLKKYQDATKSISLKAVLEKYPESTKLEYICIPAEPHERMKLGGYSREVSFMYFLSLASFD